MTTGEMLFFSGSVLGPALIARDLRAALLQVPQIAGPTKPKQPTAPDGVDRLLARAFPDGLTL